MATTIRAVTEYRPRLLVSRTVGLDDFAQRMARGSLVTKPIALLVLSTVREWLESALREGEAVQLSGVGRVKLDLRSDGRVRPIMQFDTDLRLAVADLTTYRGKIRYPEHIGLSAEDMVALWNDEHPDDPVGA